MSRQVEMLSVWLLPIADCLSPIACLAGPGDDDDDDETPIGDPDDDDYGDEDEDDEDDEDDTLWTQRPGL